jgi:hypothetical protein
MPAGGATGPQPCDVYKATDGPWRVTFGGGEWPERTVRELMARGEIHRSLTDPSLNVYNVIQKLYAIS